MLLNHIEDPSNLYQKLSRKQVFDIAVKEGIVSRDRPTPPKDALISMCISEGVDFEKYREYTIGGPLHGETGRQVYNPISSPDIVKTEKEQNQKAIDMEAYKNMHIGKLRSVAKEKGLQVPRGAKKVQILEMLSV